MDAPKLDLTPEQAADAIGVPVSDWPGRCHEIAGLCLAAKLIEGTLRYGLWTGHIAKSSRFGGRGRTHHGWVEVEAEDSLMSDIVECDACGHIRDEHARNFLAECKVDGCDCLDFDPVQAGALVFDPTRWVFEDCPPYLYLGWDKRGYYDVAGDAARLARLRPWPSGTGRSYRLRLSPPAAAHLALTVARYGGALDVEKLAGEHLSWLANLPLSLLGEHARELYQALTRGKHRGLIPIDNREVVMGDGYYGHRKTIEKRVRKKR